jgi:hypothetical protein
VKDYAIRRNPGSGRWIMYRRVPLTRLYQILGNADTLDNALKGINS